MSTIQSNINVVDDFIVVAKNFTPSYNQPLQDAQSMDARVRSIAEKVRILSNVTRVRTAEAVLKAQRKLEEVKGGGGAKSSGEGGGNGGDGARVAITQTIELSKSSVFFVLFLHLGICYILPIELLLVRGMGRRIDPSWSGPIELFLVPASAPRLV